MYYTHQDTEMIILDFKVKLYVVYRDMAKMKDIKTFEVKWLEIHTKQNLSEFLYL